MHDERTRIERLAGAASSGVAGRPKLGAGELRAFASDAKIAVLATVSPGGMPHLTLLTSLQGKDANTLTFGQFTEGTSKDNLRLRPEAAFAILTTDGRVWHGTARWRGRSTSGADYDAYNRKPLFRYNASSGIHTVHYLDLIGIVGPSKPSKVKILTNHLVTLFAASRAALRESRPILSPWSRRLLSGSATMKFFAYLREDGYPELRALIPCIDADGSRLVFPAASLGRSVVAENKPIAVFAINLQLNSVLLRGRFLGCRRYLGRQTGVIEVDWVYNSMPPKQGQIYPLTPLHGLTPKPACESGRIG